MRERLARLKAEGWEKAGCEPPKNWPGDRRQIARRAFDKAGLDPGAHPIDIAKALGFRVFRRAVGGCGGEVTDGLRILYRWDPDPEVVRYRVAHGLAHALLHRENWDHSETDALLLTLDFV